MKFKVNFNGFAYVEADNEEEAVQKYLDNDEDCKESGVDSVEEVDEFDVD